MEKTTAAAAAGGRREGEREGEGEVETDNDDRDQDERLRPRSSPTTTREQEQPSVINQLFVLRIGWRSLSSSSRASSTRGGSFARRALCSSARLTSSRASCPRYVTNLSPSIQNRISLYLLVSQVPLEKYFP